MKDRENMEGGDDDKRKWPGGDVREGQCPLCGKQLRSTSWFSMSQHMSSCHEDHPHSIERSKEYDRMKKRGDPLTGRDTGSSSEHVPKQTAREWFRIPHQL